MAQLKSHFPTPEGQVAVVLVVLRVRDPVLARGCACMAEIAFERPELEGAGPEAGLYPGIQLPAPNAAISYLAILLYW